MSTWADETQSITISTHRAMGSVFAECSVIHNKCVLWMHGELSGGNAETSHIWCVSCPVLFVAQTWCWHQPRPRRLWNFVHDNIKRALAQSSTSVDHISVESSWNHLLLHSMCASNMRTMPVVSVKAGEGTWQGPACSPSWHASLLEMKGLGLAAHCYYSRALCRLPSVTF